MLDIKEGDFLTVGGKDYPIKSCAEWSDKRLNSPAFRRMASVSASTKRPPEVSGGKRGAAAVKLSGLKCTPLDPVNAEIQKRVALNTPMELLQTFIADNDHTLHLVLEDLKNP